jgi:hypothetical protein
LKITASVIEHGINLVIDQLDRGEDSQRLLIANKSVFNEFA